MKIRKNMNWFITGNAGTQVVRFIADEKNVLGS